MACSGDPSVQDGEMRILLVGKTGVGKSSTANALLGKQVFERTTSLSSVTQETQYGEAIRFGRRLFVVDTPGFYDAERTNTEIVREIVKIFGLLSPGVHVLLYVMGVGRFTRECIKTKDLVLKTFGKDIRSRIIIVITHLDTLQSDHVDTKNYLASSGTEFLQFQELCGNKVFFINNNAPTDVVNEQVSGLLAVIDRVMKEHDNQCFTNYHLKLVRAYLRLERKRKQINLSRARKLLFDKAVNNLGLQKTVLWDHALNSPVIITVPSGAGHFHKPNEYKHPVTASTRNETDRKPKIKIVPVKGKKGTGKPEKEHHEEKRENPIGKEKHGDNIDTQTEGSVRPRSDTTRSDYIDRDSFDLEIDEHAHNLGGADDESKSVLEALEENEHTTGSDDAANLEMEMQSNRQNIGDRNFFDKFVAFFNTLFTPLLK